MTVIDYENKNFLCNKHNEQFISYCDARKNNLCLQCELDHNNTHKIIAYKSIYPNLDNIKNNIKNMENVINVFNNDINKIIDIILEKINFIIKENNYINKFNNLSDINNKINKEKISNSSNNKIELKFIFKNIAEDSYAGLAFDNAFCVFNSYKKILYLIYANYSKSIIFYNIFN